MLGLKARKTLEQAANELANNLQNRAPNNSGKLANSFTGDVVGDNIVINGADYAFFLDKGVNGKENSRGSKFGFTNKKPPISSLIGFAKAKGINEYALQSSIFKKGIRPQPFIQAPFNDEVKALSQELPQAILGDFVDNVTKGNNTIFKKQ